MVFSRGNSWASRNSNLWNTSSRDCRTIWTTIITAALRQCERACCLQFTDSKPFRLREWLLLYNIVCLFGPSWCGRLSLEARGAGEQKEQSKGGKVGVSLRGSAAVKKIERGYKKSFGRAKTADTMNIRAMCACHFAARGKAMFFKAEAHSRCHAKATGFYSNLLLS